MSTRSLRARLDRLTRANSAIFQEKDHAPDFAIDPTLAKALRDDYTRLCELRKARPYRFPRTIEDETEEERMLHARIVERAKTISCPASYGFNEVLDDQVRLQALQSAEKLPPWFAHLAQNHVKDPDAEEAQLIARIEAFRQSPEGRARIRLAKLESTLSTLSSAEYSEFEDLLTLYPEDWIHPKHLMKSAVEGWREANRREGEAARKRMQERLARNQNSLRRSSD